MRGRLEGKVAVITGAGSGIGKASARLMAEEGARVVVVDIDPVRVSLTVEEMLQAGHRAVGAVADVSDEDQVTEAVDSAVDTWGRLDVLFANAGINGVWAPIDELKLDEWNRTLAVNLNGVFLTVRAAVPHLRRRGGSIIITSSVNGCRVFSNVGASAYAASKAGLLAFSHMAALELSADNIRVNAICPGAVNTRIEESKVKRNHRKAGPPEALTMTRVVPLTYNALASPTQVAPLVVFLASDESNFISGAEIHVDGAESLFQG